MPAIEIHGLTKSYGDLQAVRGIDLVIEPGEVFGLLGPNGAGKTTTVEILEGYRDRDGGEVRVLGTDPQKGGQPWRKKLGIVLQECGFPAYANVDELITLQGAYYDHPLPTSEVLKLVGLEEKADERIKRLSGGQRRRLDLALALVGDPELIFLDEPTTGFDPGARRTAWEVIRNLKSLGKTILLTTHYMDEAQELADRVAVVTNGQIIAQGKPHEIGDADTQLTRISFVIADSSLVQSVPHGDAPITVEGGAVTIKTADPVALTNQITGWALEKKVSLDEFTVKRPSLEEAFLSLVDDKENSDNA